MTLLFNFLQNYTHSIDLDIFHPTMTQWCFSSQILFSLHIWSLYFAEFQFRSYFVPFQKCWLQQNSQLEILMIAVKFYFIIKKFHSSIPQILYHFFNIGLWRFPGDLPSSESSLIIENLRIRFEKKHILCKKFEKFNVELPWQLCTNWIQIFIDI